MSARRAPRAPAAGEPPAWGPALASRLKGSPVRYGVPLRELTTLRTGGPADALVELESEADLEALWTWVAEHGIPWFVLGKGSNLLAPDEGFPGVLVRLGRGLSQLERLADGRTVRAGAGLACAALVSGCRRWGLGGMEFLVAIPGTIGGAIAMNAGAHDGETARFLRRARYYQHGEGFREAPAEAFAFGYRTSPLRGERGRLVVAGEFALAPMAAEAIRAHEAEFQAYRRRTQPRAFPNCGSVFRNPPGDHAARLIESLGLKGMRRGAAQVSEQHANFIVNRGGATSADVLGLIDTIRESVYYRTGTLLELELQSLQARPPASAAAER